MKAAVCEDTDWLLSEEAYSIYAPCMYHPTCEDYRTQMEGFLQASSVKVFVCEDRNRKAGMMVLKFSEAAAEIIGIAVSEKLRRRGIGKQLILSAMELERIGRKESKRRRTMIQLVSTADAAFLRRKASLIIPMGQ